MLKLLLAVFVCGKITNSINEFHCQLAVEYIIKNEMYSTQTHAQALALAEGQKLSDEKQNKIDQRKFNVDNLVWFGLVSREHVIRIILY